MSGNHPSELSPRQRMINMMYLVLTALLALNVSKEVLNSFFEVNKGVVRTTNTFSDKNNETYAEFEAAAELNPVKAGEWKEKAFTVKEAAEALDIHIQEMKYDLVFKIDEEVFLGEHKDSEEREIEENIRTVPFSELSKLDKKKKIAFLKGKSKRDASGQLFFKTPKAKELKEKIISYKELLLKMAEGNIRLENNIKSTLATPDQPGKKGKGGVSWEQYNFDDMPGVGALTLLSKMQSDVRNSEADILKLLKENIDEGALKFSDAEAIQVPVTNFVLRGDSFRAEVFVSAKEKTQDPVITVGEYDSVGVGKYKMIGEEGVDYIRLKVKNGKGVFSRKATREGIQKWGGLITMQTEEGDKTYPFNGEYLVANRTAVVSPMAMNVLFRFTKNPIKISVPGVPASNITAIASVGKLTPIKKSAGEYNIEIEDRKIKKATISLYAKIEGRRTKMGEVPFRVKKLPKPKPYVPSTEEIEGKQVIFKSTLAKADRIFAAMGKDFYFQGIRYDILSFRMEAALKGGIQTAKSDSPYFNDDMKFIIKNAQIGRSIDLYDIRARLKGKRNAEIETLDMIKLQLK